MFIYKNRYEDARRVHGRNTRAANVFSFTRDRYHNNKYTNSPFYKGALLWDKLPLPARGCVTVRDLKKALNLVYVQYNDEMT